MPVDDDGTIDEAFLHFRPSENIEDIWHYFEAQNPLLVCGKVMFGERLDASDLINRGKSMYTGLICAQPTQVDHLLGRYGASHPRGVDENSDDHIRRCAEIDYEKGQAACLFPALFETGAEMAENAAYRAFLSAQSEYREKARA